MYRRDFGISRTRCEIRERWAIHKRHLYHLFALRTPQLCSGSPLKAPSAEKKKRTIEVRSTIALVVSTLFNLLTFLYIILFTLRHRVDLVIEQTISLMTALATNLAIFPGAAIGNFFGKAGSHRSQGRGRQVKELTRRDVCQQKGNVEKGG